MDTVTGDDGLVPVAYHCPEDAAAAALADYDVGDVRGVAALRSGSPLARRVIATSGSYVLKRAYRVADVEVAAEVARLLGERGIRQPHVIPTRAGAKVSPAGYVLLEYLPGSTPGVPVPAQVRAAMRHVAVVHVALRELSVGYEPDSSSVWVRVTSPDFLVAELPGLLAGAGLAHELPAAAIGYLDQARPALAALPRQLVHGDIGPDNVVMNGDTVVGLIDFTPHVQPALFAAATALYWYHVYGRRRLQPSRLLASLAAMAEVRPWDAAELAVWPAALTQEALRRLATPLELARQQVGAPGPAVGPRLAAVHAVARALPRLGRQL